MELSSRLTAALICLGLLVTPSLGQIIVPDDHPTIQQAIDAAPPGSTILVRPGVYHEAVNFTKALTLRSMEGQMVTRIDATGIPDTSAVRMIAIQGDPAILDGFTVSGGSGGLNNDDAGGGISTSGNAVITDCTFTDNHSEFGGGAALFGSNAEFVRCRFIANTAHKGGGLACYALDPTLIDCVFEANTANYGGGIYSIDCEPSIDGCEFRANTALFGGAIWIQSDGVWQPTISNSVFCGNAEGDILGDWIDGGGNSFDCPCRADFNADGQLDIFDFLAYVNAFNAGEPGADCDGDLALTLFDFLCFVNRFDEGC